jgi:hypothetical protein
MISVVRKRRSPLAHAVAYVAWNCPQRTVGPNVPPWEAPHERFGLHSTASLSKVVTATRRLLFKPQNGVPLGSEALKCNSYSKKIIDSRVEDKGEDPAQIRSNRKLGDMCAIDSNGWMQVDWSRCLVPENGPPASPVQEIEVFGRRRVYIKRDDALRLPGSQLSGNKARKMYALQQSLEQGRLWCDALVSHGGPQSNAMLALATLAAHYHVPQFVYYTKKLPRFLKDQPSGNLFRALSLGMELVELPPQEYQRLFGGDWGGNPVPPQDLPPPVMGSSLWVRI